MNRISRFHRAVLYYVDWLINLLWRWKKTTAFVIVIALIVAAFWRFLFPTLAGPVQIFDVAWLKQNWNDDQREKYYQTSQGTLIMPYSWIFALELMPRSPFLALEGPASLRPWWLSIDNTKPFASQENFTRYRLIPDLRSKYNPDQLPIGFAKEILPDRLVGQLGQGHKEWLSYTCAACHTAQITYKGLGIRIDGAPGLWNFTQFNTALANTLMATNYLSSKFDRFAVKVLQREGRPVNDAEKEKVHAELRAFLASPPIANGVLAIFQGTYPTSEGFGRMDALGRGGNSQFYQLDPVEPGDLRAHSRNIKLANAPVSIPPLWYTHDFDWVQTVAALRQPLGRNVTESWGVNAVVDLTNPDPQKQFASPHNPNDLFWLETLVSVLAPPEWPQDVFGPVDQEAVKRGKYLYEEKVFANALDPADEELWPNANRAKKGLCARCHAPVKEVEANEYGKRYWQLPMYKLKVIGTDPQDAENFAARQVYTGPLKDSMFGGKEWVGIGEALENTTNEVMRRRYQEFNIPLERQIVMNGFRPNQDRAPLAYPARPMAGYWATPPYLHNGSVPSLYQLLSPVEERDRTFWTGNLEFDPVNVGYVTNKFDGGFEFRQQNRVIDALVQTTLGIFFNGEFNFSLKIAGNSNAGHEFRDAPKNTPGVIGPALSPRDRRDIIEYMKVIRDVPPLEPAELERRMNLLKQMEPDYEGKTAR